jgi:murein DD-endopeptidase MepM/ murein hydrolase activator NlpD
MSVVSNLIFHNAKHYVTSKFGYRNPLKTPNGKTNPFHSGTDYGTNGMKIPQYAIEDGVVLSATRASDGALYVWVKYPRLGVKMLHYHLDSIKVKAGQKVDKNTILGYTGKTGKATGIHLHLGVKRLSGGDYIDPEKWAKNEYTSPTKKTSTTKKDNFLPDRGYFKKGDVSENVGKIASFMYKTFPAYTNEKALGNTYGDNLIKAVKEFQKRTGLEADGYFGEKTLKMLESYGFKK